MRLNVILTAVLICGVGHQLSFAQESVVSQTTASTPVANSAIDYTGFLKLAQEIEPYRAKRRVSLEQFKRMAEEEATVVLDTRSKWAYDAVHVAGAIHLNFSDFTKQKLSKLIPDENTRILIYCKNNFLSPPEDRFQFDPQKPQNVLDANGNLTSVEEDENQVVISATTVKGPRLALNIPTFVNLYGYGYKNIYELADQVSLDDPRLDLAGSGIQKSRSPQQPARAAVTKSSPLTNR